MALTPTQIHWLLSHSPEDIARQVTVGKVAMADLEALAVERKPFALKLPLIKTIVSSQPNPAEEQEYNKVTDMYRVAPNTDDTGIALEHYINTWQSLSAAASRVDEVRAYLRLNKEYRLFQRLEKQAPAEIERYERSGEYPREELLQALNEYIAEWGGASDINTGHIEQCNVWHSRISEILEGAVEADWQAILDDNGVLKSYEALKSFLNKYPDKSEYATAADTKLWEWAMLQPDVIAAAEIYNNHVRGMGLHSAEVSELQNSRAEWDAVRNSGLFAIMDYMDRSPDSPFINAARVKINELVPQELEYIRTMPQYNPQRFKRLFEKGICTKEQLTSASPCSDEEFERMLRHNDIVNTETLPVPPFSQHSLASNGNGKTDIVLFGLASSGKTCVLSGLVSADRISVDNANWGGKYAQSLRSFVVAHIAPPATGSEFVSLTNATITIDKKHEAPFNLVDMAGEAFRQNIVNVGVQSTGTISFAAMGDGAPEILANTNEKVFFIVVDPLATGQAAMYQRTAVQTLVSLFMSPENREVMKRVRGIHFIVTKSDTLPEPELPHAQALVHSIFPTGERDKLTRFCSDMGINASVDKKRNGRPRIFCFSLGTFHALNHFTPNPVYSEQLLEVIADYVSPERIGGTAKRLRNIFTKPLF